MTKKLTKSQIATINQIVAADPKRGNTYGSLQEAIDRATMQVTGDHTPTGYKIDTKKDGLSQQSWAKRHRVLAAALAGAGGFAGGAAVGAALGAGGVAAGGAGGAGSAGALPATSLATGSAGAGTGGLGIGATLPTATSGITGAMAGGGATGAIGTTGKAATAAKYGSKAQALSSILGQAASSSRNAKAQDALIGLNYDKFNADEGRSQLKQALAAALTQNYKPQQVQWGGPGSGLRGELPTYTGGSQAAMQGALQDPLLQELLNRAKRPAAPAQPDLKSSKLDKLLGIAALGSSLYAGVRR